MKVKRYNLKLNLKFIYMNIFNFQFYMLLLKFNFLKVNSNSNFEKNCQYFKFWFSIFFKKIHALKKWPPPF
jgi:hypothetical protein